MAAAVCLIGTRYERDGLSEEVCFNGVIQLSIFCSYILSRQNANHNVWLTGSQLGFRNCRCRISRDLSMKIENSYYETYSKSIGATSALLKICRWKAPKPTRPLSQSLFKNLLQSPENGSTSVAVKHTQISRSLHILPLVSLIASFSANYIMKAFISKQEFPKWGIL